jgi:predicted ATP-dependent endonuclease of OLD family
MIVSIHFQNFKALKNFKIHLKDLNILTGPNNNGKSTVLDGIRALTGAYRYAARYIPKFINSPYGKDAYGYEIPASSIPISLDNIQTMTLENSQLEDYAKEPARIIYKFRDGQSLTLFFHSHHPIYLFIETPRKIPKTRDEFKKEFPVQIAVIPTLGPIENDEELRDPDNFNSWYGSKRSPRMFRNYWYHNPEKFQEFQAIVEATWEGMSIMKPERKDLFSKELVMFCKEDRLDREICWAGSGFQIWLQLLTHIVNSKSADLIVVDEPEIYLHPDLQHKILRILNDTGSRIIIATHSIEIINSVEPSDVLLIDKNNKSARRIADLSDLQNIASLIGSSQNVQLTKLAKGKKILFVEGQDEKLLHRLAKICNMDEIFASREITVIPINGFSQYERVIHSNWAFSKILGEEIKISVLLDRDYRSDEYLQTVFDKLKKEVNAVHILKKKEIENYFLIPAAIKKAIDAKLDEVSKTRENFIKPSIVIETLLRQLTDEVKAHVFSQTFTSKFTNEQIRKHTATLIKDETETFDFNWRNLDYRLKTVSGKELMNLLNSYLQTNFCVNITYAQVAKYISPSNIDSDMKSFLSNLESFRKNIDTDPPRVSVFSELEASE